MWGLVMPNFSLVNFSAASQMWGIPIKNFSLLAATAGLAD